MFAIISGRIINCEITLKSINSKHTYIVYRSYISLLGDINVIIIHEMHYVEVIMTEC